MKYKGPGVKIMMDYRTADEEFKHKLMYHLKMEILYFWLIQIMHGEVECVMNEVT